MTAQAANDRLAILLTALGDDVATAALASMNPTLAIDLKRRLDVIQDSALSDEMTEKVVDDFLSFVGVALQQAQQAPADASARDSESGNAKKSSIQYFPKIAITDDPVSNLNRLDAYQVAQAICGDHPKTIALVLGRIDVGQAAKVLELLPASVRSETVIQLTQEPSVPNSIVKEILKTTVRHACAIEFRPELVDRSQVIADLMRSVPKAIRLELMGKLEQSDGSVAERVKSKLYIFDDILRLGDRDVQKLLANIETDALIVALQRCQRELVDKLLSNLSKRARESILEEMEYKQSVSDEEIDASRAIIVEALAKLDESGEIKM